MQMRGKYAFLSNFYQRDFWYEGKQYPTAEHAFQAAKDPARSHEFAYRQREDGSREYPVHHTPWIAKREGRHLTLRPDWEKVKVGIMESIVREKFTQNPDLADALIAVTEPITEENTWGDYFWGMVNGKGKNHLGKILTRVREQFIEERKAALTQQ